MRHLSRKTVDNSKMIAKIVGSLVAGAAGVVVLSYLRSGRRAHKAPLIPEPIEHELDKVVAWLDTRLGKEWVDFGMDALQLALSGTGLKALTRVLGPLLQTEHTSQESALSHS
jgi:hypothetical protein